MQAIRILLRRLIMISAAFVFVASLTGASTWVRLKCNLSRHRFRLHGRVQLRRRGHKLVNSRSTATRFAAASVLLCAMAAQPHAGSQ
jgi:hypothetical protein